MGESYGSFVTGMKVPTATIDTVPPLAGLSGDKETMKHRPTSQGKDSVPDSRPGNRSLSSRSKEPPTIHPPVATTVHTLGPWRLRLLPKVLHGCCWRT